VIALGLGQASTAVSKGTEREDVSDIAARLDNILGSRLEVLEPIAIGGMATIFRLRHRLHQGFFVAKVLHPGLTDRPGIVSSFREEATNAARLGGHPNAVPVFDFGEQDGLFFMTMPFIEGEDLDKLLQRTGPRSQDETLAFAAQISSMLSFAETEGIVHCDLTPANIRLDVFGLYRLLDFGISHSAAFTRQRSFRGGTPLYTSPEQLRGEVPDCRSDLYALGVILAEMLNGSPLFHDETLAAIDRRHLNGEWTLPEMLTSGIGFGLLLERLLATDREDRFQSAFELSGVLEGLGFARPEFSGRFSTRLANQSAHPMARRGRLSAG
jgi:serine/threonine protein kinase